MPVLHHSQFQAHLQYLQISTEASNILQHFVAAVYRHGCAVTISDNTRKLRTGPEDYCTNFDLVYRQAAGLRIIDEWNRRIRLLPDLPTTKAI